MKKISEHNYDLDVAFSDKLVSRFGHPDSWKPNFKSRNKHVIPELNSSFFRSDEFVTEHNEKHVLFAGCSYTWGEGALYNATWGYKVLKMMGISGYYNIGTPAASIQSQVFNIFKYINLYGRPDVIFFNMPGVDRFYVAESKKEIYDGAYDPIPPFLPLVAYQYYFMLETFCKINNIQLFSFSWNQEKLIEFCFDSFDTFYKIDTEIMLKEINKLSNVMRTIGFDDMHLGEAYHEYWARFIYGKFKDVNN